MELLWMCKGIISWLEACAIDRILCTAYHFTVSCLVFSYVQVKSTSIGWSLGYMLSMSNMIPSEVKEILPMTNPVFAGLIFLFSALTIVTVVIVFIFLIRSCFWELNSQENKGKLSASVNHLWGCCNPVSSATVAYAKILIVDVTNENVFFYFSAWAISIHTVFKNWRKSLTRKTVYPARFTREMSFLETVNTLHKTLTFILYLRETQRFKSDLFILSFSCSTSWKYCCFTGDNVTLSYGYGIGILYVHYRSHDTYTHVPSEKCLYCSITDHVFFPLY